MSPGAVMMCNARVSPFTAGRVTLFVVETLCFWDVVVVEKVWLAFDGSVGRPDAAPVRVMTPPLRAVVAVEVMVRGPLTVAVPTVALFGVTVVCVVLVSVSGVIVFVGTPLAS